MKKFAVLSLLVLATFVGYSQVEKFKALMVYQVAINSKFDAGKSSGDFIIGVKDNPKVLAVLTALSKAKKVGTRAIVVKAISGAGDAAGCSIVYVSTGDAAGFKGACEAGKTLLYSEGEGTCGKGAGVSFFIGGGKPKFEISPDNMKACGVTPSGKLLAMGKKV